MSLYALAVKGAAQGINWLYNLPYGFKLALMMTAFQGFIRKITGSRKKKRKTESTPKKKQPKSKKKSSASGRPKPTKAQNCKRFRAAIKALLAKKKAGDWDDKKERCLKAARAGAKKNCPK